MALFEWHAFESSIIRWAWVQIISPERRLLRGSPQQEWLAPPAPERSFAVNTHSRFFMNRGNFFCLLRVPLLKAVPPIKCALLAPKRKKEHTMGGELIGLVAVILGMGVPLGALYTYYRVRKLRSEERLAAIWPGGGMPVGAEFNQGAASRPSAH